MAHLATCRIAAAERARVFPYQPSVHIDALSQSPSLRDAGAAAHADDLRGSEARGKKDLARPSALWKGNCLKPNSSQLDVPLTGLFGLLLEAVKDVYALRSHRQIEHSESTFRFMDPGLASAGKLRKSSLLLPIQKTALMPSVCAI
jgi:hypothetical protein